MIVKRERVCIYGLLAISLGLNAAIFVLLHARDGHNRTNVGANLKVRSLDIVDKDGTARLRFGASLPDPQMHGVLMKRRSAATGIQLNDARGDETGGLVMMDDGTIDLCFDQEEEATCMYTFPTGERGFSIADRSGKERAELVLSDQNQVQLRLKNQAERVRVLLAVNPDGSVKVEDGQKGEAVERSRIRVK